MNKKMFTVLRLKFLSKPVKECTASACRTSIILNAIFDNTYIIMLSFSIFRLA